jgi:signal transduction histidine kinase
MNDMPSARSKEMRPHALVALGAAFGAAYVVFDLMSEARIRAGTLRGPLANAHEIVDHALPIVVGALLGVCVHYLRLRARLTLAEEAASRADALRTRLQRVERDQAVWVLAAAVLHELKNPLHALGLLLDELSASDGDATERTRLLERARTQIDRMRSQLEGLRSMRSVREPEIQSVLLDHIVATLAQDLGCLAADDGLVVRIESDGPVYANADPTFVRTILENLLDNGLQALQERGGGSIAIRIASERDHAVIRVSDDGPALDASARAALFEPLRTTKAHGLGLGLPIARALARAMSGDLVLDEADVKAFRLELPPCPKSES